MNLLREYKQSNDGTVPNREKNVTARRRFTSSDRNLSRWGDIIKEVEEVKQKVDDRNKSSTMLTRKPSRDQVVVFDDPFKVRYNGCLWQLITRFHV